MGPLAAVLALLLSWQPPATLCGGLPMVYPEQVHYVVPYLVRDAPGLAMPWRGEWVTWDTEMLIDAQPDPPVGVVYDVQEPEACNPAGCSGGCAP
jgi:hypothetical protein